MKFLALTMRLIAPLVVMCCLFGASSQVAQAQSATGRLLWLGNDTVGNVFQTNTKGNVITNLASIPTTGIAWTGTNLYFADPSGNFTKRTADGQTVLDSFVIGPFGGEDLAWDSKRKVLWRILHAPNTLQKIDPVGKTLIASYAIPNSDPGFLGTLGGLGIAYDSTRDELDVSFCSVGCSSLSAGLVDRVDPNTGNVLGQLFRTSGFATGGLAYDPGTDTLWVGDSGVVRNMDRAGNVLSSFSRPTPGGFVDGLEITGVVSEDSNFTPSVLASGLSGPSGVAVDLVVSQFGANQVSLVNATSGAISAFANQTAPDEVAVRSSDGLVAVKTQVTGQSAGPIDFYSSTGALLGSIPAGNPNGCITGLAFDASGNLLVAAGPPTAVAGGCLTTGWALYKFPQQAGQPTPSTTASSVLSFPAGDLIEGLAFSAAPLPSGSLYAVSSTNGHIYQIHLPACTDCGFSFTNIATVPTTIDQSGNPNPGIAGITVDPVGGDIFISEFNGPNILRMPPPIISTDPPPTIFATGFRNTFGLAFDGNGNLYVNETNAGNLWKFTRASFATPPQPVIQGKTNMLTFPNPDPARSDQISTLLIPASADLGGTVAIQYIYVDVDPARLNARLALGSTGDPFFFGGGPVAPGATCTQVPSSNNKCVIQIQKCINADGSVQAICKVREPAGSSDLIQLTFKFAPAPTTSAATSLPCNLGFLIDYDTPPNNQTLTDITTFCSSDPTSGGGTKTLCSQTFTVKRAAPVGADFSLSLSQGALSLPAGPSSATVTVTSINGFNSPVALGVSDVPVGLSATLSKTSVTPPANGSDSTTTLTVAVSTDASISSITTIIGNLLAGGCIDNAGVANALTSKLSAAQAAIGGGQVQTAINTLTAFKNQVQAQTGKHINTSCTTTFTLIVSGTAGSVVRFTQANVNATFNPGTVLLNDVQFLINSLKTSLSSPDPITGFVVNASGAGVASATVTLLDSSSPTPNTIATTTTDATGFYYFATTSTLTKGANYTIQVTVPTGFNNVTPASQPFTWGGSGLAFNFTLN